ncbi:MAG: hypothetical protein CMJ83_02325 [Planctomycetes bacterium]|nr:hypothetical protein [Planctomycetota bacterium]
MADLEFEPKPLSKAAVEGALDKAERYRLLNEPADSESIARDVLRVDPGNQEAVVTLLLSLTDQFTDRLTGRFQPAWDLLEKIEDEHDRFYYTGIICERRGKAHHRQENPGSGQIGYDWLRQAMDWYEKAEKIRAKGRDDAVLRWNACARIINRHPLIYAKTHDETHPPVHGE